jgi:hypothetical protein
MQFESREKAMENQAKIVDLNLDPNKGHWINDKRVDVKSTDDYIKPPPGQKQVRSGLHGLADLGGPMGPGGLTNELINLNKPNPYVIVEMDKDKENELDPASKVVFKYPKAKIFVGGLDFKLGE